MYHKKLFLFFLLPITIAGCNKSPEKEKGDSTNVKSASIKRDRSTRCFVFPQGVISKHQASPPARKGHPSGLSFFKFSNPIASFTVGEWEPDTLWGQISIVVKGKPYPLDMNYHSPVTDNPITTLVSPLRTLHLSHDGKLACINILSPSKEYLEALECGQSVGQLHYAMKDEKSCGLGVFYIDIQRRCWALLVDPVYLKSFAPQQFGDCSTNEDGSVRNETYYMGANYTRPRFYLINQVIAHDHTWMKRHKQAISPERLKCYASLCQSDETLVLAKPYQKEFTQLFNQAQQYPLPDSTRRQLHRAAAYLAVPTPPTAH